jgi:hypothetical protein
MKGRDWLLLIGFVYAGFALSLFCSFVLTHGRMPVGSGEVWNWLFGWG